MRINVIPDVKAATDSRRLYPIRSHEDYGLYAGRTSRGDQLLAAADGLHLLVALFDATGNLSETAHFNLPLSAIAPDFGPSDVLRFLSNMFGFTESTIHVKRFHVPHNTGESSNSLQRSLIGEPGLDVAPFPSLLQEFLDDPSAYNSEDHLNYCEMVTRWVADRHFVLHWGIQTLDQSRHPLPIRTGCGMT
jgi:hypothetical protein